MPRSEKPPVVEYIYKSLVDPITGRLTRTIVTNEDVVNAINWCRENLGLNLSAKNPANFIKDIIRGKSAASMWPESLKQARVSARQVTGYGNVFEFVPYLDGQVEPFPDNFGYHAGVQKHRIQSVSMPLASKALGRDDETYLIQVAVKLAVVETHFALQSPIQVVELNHLQIGIKLRLCELDSLFSATYVDEFGKLAPLIITAEAKRRDQRILEDQIVRQVHAAFAETETPAVVPIAMTASAGGIYIAEFKKVWRPELEDFKQLELEAEGLYVLEPPVQGI